MQKETSNNKKTFDCPDCDFSTESEHGLSSHRSQVHNTSFTVNVECDHCGTEVERNKCDLGDSVVCSNECRSKYFSDRKQSKEYIEKRIAPQRNKVEVECDFCGNEFLRTPKRVENTEHQYCDFDCKSKHQGELISGSNHPRWSGGVTGIDYIRKNIGNEPWKKVAERVRKKYDHTCQNCGCETTDTHRSLDVHHIVPLTAGGTNAEELLIPLCLKCHRKVESYTQNLVENYLIIEE